MRINAAASTEDTLQQTVDAARAVLGARQATITSTAGDPFARRLSAAAPAGGAGAELGPPLGVMLRSAGRPLGMLEVRDGAERTFSPRDEAILAQLGQLASVAIAKSQAYSRERHIAQVLQRSLLPPALTDHPGLSSAVRFIAAGEGIEVGGDFYDFFLARPGRVAALIGDVCGKGPEAASVTALARHTLRAAAVYESRPSEVLQLLHKALRAARSDGRFCTVAYCDLEPGPDGARMVLACGGHPLPLVLRAGGLVEPVGQLGTLLGADVDARPHRRRGAARARRPRGLLHGRRHGGARRAARALRPPRPGPAARPPARACRPTSSPSASRTRCSTRPSSGRATTSRCSSSAPAPRLPRFPDPEENLRMADPDQPVPAGEHQSAETSAALLRELVAHLRENRTNLREEWARRITEAQLLTALTPEEIFSEATSVYDNYVEVLETGSVEALQDYARNLSERIIPRGVETDEVLGIVLLLRDVLARSLFEKYQDDFTLLNRVLDAYEPAANRIANTVGVNFVQERERIIRQQQEAIRELSTPVLQVRERLLILPIIGVLDSQRARQLTEQLLRGIRDNRAKVVVIDITGVPTIDSTVANHLVQTVEASRLMGASVIITGLSSEIAQTLVTIGVDLSKVNAVGDLQGGIEEAERLLGYEVRTRPATPPRSRAA